MNVLNGESHLSPHLVRIISHSEAMAAQVLQIGVDSQDGRLCAQASHVQTALDGATRVNTQPELERTYLDYALM